MSEEWGSDFDRPAEKKKSIAPVLAWVFGAGCLLVILVLLVGGILLARFYQRSTDPDRQWPRVAEVLPFDQRPADLSILGIGFGGQRTWIITLPGEKHQVLLHHLRGPDIGEQREAFFESAEPFPLQVQGRELKAIRLEPGQGKGGEPSFPDLLSRFAPGASMRLELSPPGSSELVLMQLTALESKDPVPEQLVIDFLGRFQVGQMR